MRYLGLVAAIVALVCAFVYVTRLPFTVSPSPDAANSNSYASTINSVRNTVHAGAEQRRKWALQLQMKDNGMPSGFSDGPEYSTEGETAEILVVRSDNMDLGACSDFAKGENGLAAATLGFISVSCRTKSNGIIREVPLH